MSKNTEPPRKPRGSRAGGQFIAKSKTEAPVLGLVEKPPEAPSNQHRNPDGSLGGMVATTAHVSETAFIGPDARVLDRATVLGNARVLDRATVLGNARVADDAVVSGEAIVGDEKSVTGR
jgi:hypothetical protein